MTTTQTAEQIVSDLRIAYVDPYGLPLIAANFIEKQAAEIERLRLDAAQLRDILRLQQGHAKGWYMNKCIRCDKQMELVDKRCYICVECTDDAIAAGGAAMTRALVQQMLDAMLGPIYGEPVFGKPIKAAITAAREYLAAPEQSESVDVWLNHRGEWITDARMRIGFDTKEEAILAAQKGKV